MTQFMTLLDMVADKITYMTVMIDVTNLWICVGLLCRQVASASDNSRSIRWWTLPCRAFAGPKIVCFLTQSVQLTLSSVQLTLLECVM